MHFRNCAFGVLAAALAAPPIAGAVDLTLTPNLSSGQRVGTTIVWTTEGTGVGPFDYRLAVNGEIIYDFGQRDEFDWTPLKEGSYFIVATVKDNGDGSIKQASRSFRILPVPLATQRAVVSDTRNPLVALYSAPECSAGLFMRVTFRGSNPGARQYRTDAKPCVAGQTMNFYIAGMRASTSHIIRHQLETSTGLVVSQGPVRNYTTGAIGIPVPTATVLVPPAAGASVEDSIVVIGTLGGQGFNVAAADLEGNTVWYYQPPQGGEYGFTRWTDGGTFFMTGPSAAADRFVMREADLAGNTVRETNSRRIADQLKARGNQIISVVHHEVRRLPDGNIAVLGSNERLLEDVQGPGIVDVIGDQVLVLDRNMQLIWQTNLFSILDPTRVATGNETCVSGGPGCPLLMLADTANDWTHSNAIGYSPEDGNLTVSIRHQDWVIKVDYRNGAGDGSLIWKLGKEGDFVPLGFTPGIDPWFTHQHDANFVGTDGGFIVYDNGNRNDACIADPADCLSRGQAWTLDETAMTATLDTNASLGDYSFAVGASEKLSNGNYSFNDGIPGGATFLSHQDEFLPDGTKVYSIQFNARAYRGYRLRDMYTAPSYR